MFTYLLFALVVAKGIESGVVREYPLTADGLQLDLEVKNKDTVLWKMQVDVNEKDKTVRVTRSQPQAPAVVATTSNATLPTLENRSFIGVGLCPTGYVKRGTFCFLDDDYDDR